MAGYAQPAGEPAAPAGKLVQGAPRAAAPRRARGLPEAADAAAASASSEQSEALVCGGREVRAAGRLPQGAWSACCKAYALQPQQCGHQLQDGGSQPAERQPARRHQLRAKPPPASTPKTPITTCCWPRSRPRQKQYDAGHRAPTPPSSSEVPNSGSYLFNLADLYLAQNKLPEALATLDQAEKQFGQVDEISFKKQQIYLKQNKLDLALAEGEKLIRANPTEPRYVLAQAEMYASNNRLPDAMRVAQQALQARPRQPAGPPDSGRGLPPAKPARRGRGEQLRLAFDSSGAGHRRARCASW
ncbi:MAG: tetratricopeptide repeat protein [Hymenobacter sp.]